MDAKSGHDQILRRFKPSGVQNSLKTQRFATGDDWVLTGCGKDALEDHALAALHLAHAVRRRPRPDQLRCVYRGTSLTRKRPPLAPYRWRMPRVLGGA